MVERCAGSVKHSAFHRDIDIHAFSCHALKGRVHMKAAIQIQLSLATGLVLVRRCVDVVVVTEMLGSLARFMLAIGASHRPGNLEWDGAHHENEKNTA